MPDPKLKFELSVDDKGTVKMKRFGKEVDTTRLKGGRFGKAMLKAASGVGKLTGKVAKSVAKVGALGGALAAASGAFIAKKSVDQFIDFEVALAKVGNVSSESLASIKNQVQGISPELGNATELVQGLYQVISAGVTDPVKKLELLEEASRVAKVQQLEQGEVVRGLAAFMGAYSEELDKSSTAADKLFTIERLGITTVGELVPHIGSLANMAKAAGLSSDELSASLAQVTASGSGTAESVTQIQSLFRGLLKPTAELEKVFKSYGGTQEAIKELGFPGVLKKVQQASGGTASGMLKLFGRAEAVSAMLQLQKENFGQLEDKMFEVTQATGASASAWDRYSGTLQATWDTFKNTMVNQAILLGEKLAPAIKDVLNLVAELFARWKDPITKHFGAFVSLVEEKMRGWLPSMGQIIVRIKLWWHILKTKHIPTWTIWFEKIKAVVDLAARGAEFIMSFIGRGSTEKPLGEKIEEMEQRIIGFTATVEGQKPIYEVDFSQSVENARLLTDSMDMVASATEGASFKARTLEQTILDAARAGSVLAEAQRAGFGALVDIGAQARKNVMAIQAALERERELADAKIRADEMRAEAGIGGSFQAGTGLEGLPHTGTFKGHQGEIVLDPGDSQALREGKGLTGLESAAGGGGGITVMVDFRPMFITGDRMSMEQAGEALGGVIQRKLKRIS
ncbi:MAG: phage tail tape measure protein [Thermoplasmata archaeon]|nr:phage tail tape measure protein [Thermoplasmata archaeon]